MSNKSYFEGQTITMKACELHTVYIKKGQKCAWLIEETKPTCEYFPINYSTRDLTTWNAEGLYIECDDSVKEKYIGQFSERLK